MKQITGANDGEGVNPMMVGFVARKRQQLLMEEMVELKDKVDLTSTMRMEEVVEELRLIKKGQDTNTFWKIFKDMDILGQERIQEAAKKKKEGSLVGKFMRMIGK